MTSPITFDVVGVPAPQGSHRAFVVNGRARMTEAAGTKGTQWRDAVAQAARNVAPDTPLDGPLRLTVEFRFPMPTSRRAAARAAGIAPKIGAPDLDKLVRAVGDALTEAGLITDDARICTVVAHKYEVVGWTGARIRIEEVPT